MYNRRHGLDRKLRARRTAFVPIRVTSLRHDSDFDALYPPKVFDRQADSVTCRKGGVSVARLLQMDMRGVLAARAESR